MIDAWEGPTNTPLEIRKNMNKNVYDILHGGFHLTWFAFLFNFHQQFMIITFNSSWLFHSQASYLSQYDQEELTGGRFMN